MDDPEDVRGLTNVLSTIIDIHSLEKPNKKQLDFIEKHQAKIDKIIYDSFKADRIKPRHYGIVHIYLGRIGGTQGTINLSILKMF